MAQAFRFKTTPSLNRLGTLIGAAAQELQDWRPAFKEFLPIVGPAQAEALERKAGAANWAELNPRWVKRKQTLGKRRAAGIFSGRLQRELMANVAHTRITKLDLDWGPKQRYAYIFHWGVEGRQPGREFLGWTPVLSTALYGIMSGRAEEIMTRAMQAWRRGK